MVDMATILREQIYSAVRAFTCDIGDLRVARGLSRRHKKRMSDYAVIGVGKMQSDQWCDPYHSIDMREVVIYRGKDGQLWVRPSYEFNDGRFEALPAPTAEQA